ncbi:OprD family outer membrane porin [Cedecea neteri]|nr:OprD family outer membrane porin [Cedecea neteri]
MSILPLCTKKHATKCILLLSGMFSVIPVAPAMAAGFVDDSLLTGSLYYWQRHRERKEMNPGSPHYGQYQTNLHHSTTTARLDYSSGFYDETVGGDLGAFATVDLFEGSTAHPNEISFSDGKSMWRDRGTGEANAVDLYLAALKFKKDNYWLRAGYIQPIGQGLLATQWGFLPGTYQGVEMGAVYDLGQQGTFSLSYFWANKYKAPWYREMYDFKEIDKKTKIPYLHSLGGKFDFKNGVIWELAFGQSQGYLDKYFTKVGWRLGEADNQLRTSWQFYGSHDATGRHDVYDEFAWQQGVTAEYQRGRWQFRLEGSLVHAPGKQGYYTVSATPIYPNSAGRIDMWWDARSDYNADGEKAVFFGSMVDLGDVIYPGISAGASLAWGWDGKPARGGEWSARQRLTESAWNLDLVWQVQQGWAKDVMFKLHYTRYNNHSDNPDWSGGYANVFQDEKDIKFMMIAPFSII